MRGRTAARPLAEIAAAAGHVFTAKGFRSAGISDVSAALGLSHGALYTYVDSKQALLYLALRHALQPETVDDLLRPVSEPPQEIMALVESWATSQRGFQAFIEAITRPSTRPVAQELGDIIDELYDFIERNRHILALIAACATDLPELAQWYFVQRRRAMLEHLGGYLHQRIGEGQLPPVPDVPTAARFIVETIAWFAMHRHGDPDSAMLNDHTSRQTVHHLLTAAFLPATKTTPEYRKPRL
jgi:AcrR family transcriptional regulator